MPHHGSGGVKVQSMMPFCGHQPQGLPLEGLSEVAVRFMPHLAPAPEPVAEDWG
jgi:hypothetical protein